VKIDKVVNSNSRNSSPQFITNVSATRYLTMTMPVYKTAKTLINQPGDL
jgi:hypothetical protein